MLKCNLKKLNKEVFEDLDSDISSLEDELDKIDVELEATNTSNTYSGSDLSIRRHLIWRHLWARERQKESL